MSNTEAVSSDKDVSDGEKSTHESEDENLKVNKTLKKSKKNPTDSDKNNEPVSKSKPKLKVTQKKKLKKDKAMKLDSKEENEKIPLLDQSPIVEGSRSRKTVVNFESKVPISKHSPIEIPQGKGTPLGRIPLINIRLKRLRQNVLKELHRTIFGKCGDPANFITNLQKFNGFPFKKESDEYNRKFALFNKFHMPDIKELLFFLDLDMKIKKKEDAVKCILDFLVLPEPTENTQNAQPFGHPKRKATKRNYIDADVDDIDLKKKKKPKVANKSSKEEQEEESGKSVKENHKKVANVKNTKNTAKERSEDESHKDEESESDHNSELKKPAKKRKRNQIIEEQEESAEETKLKKNKADDKNKNSSKKGSISKKAMSDDEENSASELTDDELRNFLKKVLADANLEETTMKTVYGLISTHYPNYNFAKKKDFIKEVVKSLLQS